MKLYPCQKIALARMDESSDRTNDGIWTYRVKCALTNWGAALRMPEEYTKYSEKDLKEEYEKHLIYLLCKSCDWKGEE